MRLELTKKTDLAFQAMAYIAGGDGGRVNGADLAAQLDISAQYLPHVMSPLTKRGWVSSVSGPHGGYELSAELDDVTLLDLIEAVEGPVDDSRCLHLGPMHDTDGSCAETSCALHEPWTKARSALLHELRETHLSDMMVAH